METFEVDDSFVSESAQFDLTLIVDTHKIRVSKAVLCIASPVFRAMLGSDFKEKEQNEIELPGKNYNAFVSFLECFYPDRMKNVTSDTVYRVLPIAHEYQVNALIMKCHGSLLQLVKKYHVGNVAEICRHIRISELYNLGDLNKTCVSIASEFSLEELEKAAKKYPITDCSLIRIHHQARMRYELGKKDDEELLRIVDYRKSIKGHIDQMFWHNPSKLSLLQKLRLCYRYFPDNQRLFEGVIEQYTRLCLKPETSQDACVKSKFDIEKELSLLPVKVKQMLLL